MAKRKRSGISPTQRSLKLLRDEGYLAEVVEKRIPYSHITKDLFGVIDIVAIRADTIGVIGVQTTSDSNRSARLQKILKSEEIKVWLASGNRLVIHAWGQRGKAGARKVWEPNAIEVTKDQFTETVGE